MFEQTVDVTRLDGFVRYTRGIVRARLVLVALFVGLLAIYTPMRMTLFGLVELCIYAALFLATEAASRHPDPIAAFRRCAGNRSAWSSCCRSTPAPWP
jgi:hypothetical protein